MKTKITLGASALVLAMLALAPVATAQTSGEDAEARQKTIIVTATKRDATIQDVPFSINAQTADDIARSGAGNLEDVARSVAGLSIQNLGPGQSQVAVRGVSAGQIVRDQPGVKEQVTTMVFSPSHDLLSAIVLACIVTSWGGS